MARLGTRPSYYIQASESGGEPPGMPAGPAIFRLGAPEPDQAWSRTLGVAAMELLWALAPTLSSLLVAVRSSPRALWQVELAKMMGGCYLCSTGGMLLAVSIAFSDRTESQ